jgi:hypothetical protein
MDLPATVSLSSPVVTFIKRTYPENFNEICVLYFSQWAVSMRRGAQSKGQNVIMKILNKLLEESIKAQLLCDLAKLRNYIPYKEEWIKFREIFLPLSSEDFVFHFSLYLTYLLN